MTSSSDPEGSRSGEAVDSGQSTAVTCCWLGPGPAWAWPWLAVSLSAVTESRWLLEAPTA